MSRARVLFIVAVASVVASLAMGQPYSSLVYPGEDQRLEYAGYANDGQTSTGNLMLDYSYAGYKGGGVAIPLVPAEIELTPQAGDDTSRIQAAIDRVSEFEPSPSGFRGAILLTAGSYEVTNTLNIRTSGVVIRGEGQHSGGTVLHFTAPFQHDAFSVIGSGTWQKVGDSTAITDTLIPNGMRSFNVADASDFSVGDRVLVERTPNTAWIEAVRMDETHMGSKAWSPENFIRSSHHKITSISGNTVTLDVPLGHAIESRYGGAELVRYHFDDAITNVGIEGLRLESSFVADDDEDHAWHGVEFQGVEDCWVRQVTCQYFGATCVFVNARSMHVTIEDCAALDPKALITGGRGYAFTITRASHILVQRCYAEKMRHSFATGTGAIGPNVFLDSLDELGLAGIGPHAFYSQGLLFDNIRGFTLNVQNRHTLGSGQGWTGAQVLYWNSLATDFFRIDTPAGAMNYGIGCIGQKTEGSRVQEDPCGIWESQWLPVTPRSLYYKQLEDRLGTVAMLNVTSREQRFGTIWNALSSWRGNSVPAGRPLVPLQVDAGEDLVTEDFGWTHIAAAVKNPLPDNFPITSLGWTQVSGPASAIFEDASAQVTRVSFPIEGTYVLQYDISQADNRDPQNVISHSGFDTVTFAVRYPYEWEGQVDSDWDNASNWAGGVLPRTISSGVYDDDTTIIIQDGENAPAVNVPDWAHSSSGTPRFVIEDGASLTIDMAQSGYGGPTGPGQIVTVDEGASLTWGVKEAGTRIRLARLGSGVFAYDVIGGAFTIDAARIEFGAVDEHLTEFNLNGGAFTFTGNTIVGAGGDLSAFTGVSSVTLTRGASFNSASAGLRGMFTSSGDPTMFFDLRDSQSSVTAKFGFDFPDFASLRAAVGTTWISSTLGDDSVYFLVHNDGTFTATVNKFGDYIWTGNDDGDWNNALNWASGVLPQTLSGEVYDHHKTIIILNGANLPTVNVPDWAHGSSGTPRFVVDDGASLTIDMAETGYGGPTIPGQIVTVEKGASLTWGVKEFGTRIRLARLGTGVFAYDVLEGAFTIDVSRIEFGAVEEHLSEFRLDGGTFTFTGDTIVGGGGDLSAFLGRSSVTLARGSSFNSGSAALRGMFTSSGDPTMIFDIQDSQSSVTARYGFDFPDLASLEASLGTTWTSSTLGDHGLTLVDNGDGTFTVSHNGGVPSFVEEQFAVAFNIPEPSGDDLVRIAPLSDFDGDGVSNIAELQFGFDPTDSASGNLVTSLEAFVAERLAFEFGVYGAPAPDDLGPNQDFDSDDRSNLVELQLGLDPTNPLDELEGVEITPTIISLAELFANLGFLNLGDDPIFPQRIKPDSDFDGDGESNLFELALGGNVGSASLRSALKRGQMVGDDFIVTYVRLKSAEQPIDLSIMAQCVRDLKDAWLTLPLIGISESLNPDQSGIDTTLYERIDLKIDTIENGCRFVRVAVEDGP